MVCKKSSALTQLFWLIEDEKIEPQALLKVVEVVWPRFAEKDNFVFLTDEFSMDAYSRLVGDGHNPEFWINLLSIDPLFAHLSGWKEKSIEFVKALVPIWIVKLKNEFPAKNFSVRYFCHEEDGDCCLTFFQSEANAIAAPEQTFFPNVKENNLEAWTDDFRLGIPKIRKPYFDEIPHS